MLFGEPTSKEDAKPERTVSHQKNVGEQGSVSKTRAQLIDPMALGGSTPGEGLDGKLLKMVFGLSFLLWNEHGHRMMMDRAWCEAFAEAGRRTLAAAVGFAPARTCIIEIGRAHV